MLQNTIIVTFTAPEHSGKTTIEAAFCKLMAQHGIPVKLPYDPQRDAKMQQSVESLLETFKEKGITVMIMESNST